MYEIVFSEEAKKDLKELNKKAPKAINKLENLLLEIKEHPRTGTGKVEVLKGYDGNILSRRISSEHRIIYRVKDDSVEVLVLSVFGHYR
ncbi:MAG: Txe/YoeB family addiction module toxin [Bacteroidales bacterium]